MFRQRATCAVINKQTDTETFGFRCPCSGMRLGVSSPCIVTPLSSWPENNSRRLKCNVGRRERGRPQVKDPQLNNKRVKKKKISQTTHKSTQRRDTPQFNLGKGWCTHVVLSDKKQGETYSISLPRAGAHYLPTEYTAFDQHIPLMWAQPLRQRLCQRFCRTLGNRYCRGLSSQSEPSQALCHMFGRNH